MGEYSTWKSYRGDWKIDWNHNAEFKRNFEKMQEEERKRQEAYEAYAELDQSEDLNDDPRVRKLF